MLDTLERVVFTRRRALLLLLALLTLGLAYEATHLRVDAGFEKRLPLGHPYIQTLLEHRGEFGGADRLLIAVRARDGDMFTRHFFETLRAVTDAVFFLPGVDRSSVRSLFTPNVRFVEIVEGGFVGGNVVPADFQPTPEGLAEVRANILKAGIVGRLVARDLSAAIVSAELIERAPGSGRRVDYVDLAHRLEAQVRRPFVDEQIDVHVIGFAQAIGDVADGATGVLALFGLTLMVISALVFAFVGSIALAALPLACSLVAVVWSLGLLALLDYGLDPMSVLLPFLIFAIGVSHGVQMVNAARAEIERGAGALDAARSAFRRLLVPGIVALASDAAGFLTILVIDIGIIRELAITATLGVSAIIVTNLLLLPLLLAGVRPDRSRSAARPRVDHAERAILAALGWFARPRGAAAALSGAAVLFALGLWQARDLEVGDLQRGVPELRADSRYNRDAALIAERFDIGVDLLSIPVETVADGCVAHDVMAAIDRFAWHLANVPGVQSVLSLAALAKLGNAGWNEGHPKWRVLPDDPRLLAQDVAPIETSSGLLNGDCSVMPVLAFTADHRAATIERLIGAARDFAAQNDGERHVFRLAMGNLGVMAATNQVIEAAALPLLLYVYGAVGLICLLAFRSVRGTLCVLLPLALVSVLVQALMSLLGIGLKVSTLPVAALGVGIGVDYGIYVYAQLRRQLAAGLPVAEAYRATLATTGRAVLLTGLTLAAGVAGWLVSALQFQADMGLLLAFMFLANMLGALVLLPALACLLHPAA